jgi:hypothetical protein
MRKNEKKYLQTKHSSLSFLSIGKQVRKSKKTYKGIAQHEKFTTTLVVNSSGSFVSKAKNAIYYS